MKDAITVTGMTGVTTTTTEEVRRQRDELLLAARHLGAVINDDDAKQAADTMLEIKSLVRTVEAGRSDAKAPVIALGKAIDALAAELTDAINAEARRLGLVIGTYQIEQRRKHELVRQAAWQKEQDIISDARLEMATATYGDSVEQLETKTFEAVALVRASVGLAPTIAGTATRKQIQFEVTDAAAAYAAQPAMFTLTPNVTAIKAILKSQPKLVVPGLLHWVEAVAVSSGR
tara:strand:+ start:2281 stop:2976 length:696 start_codon:yes stop_codon:yes gene_type:complete